MKIFPAVLAAAVALFLSSGSAVAQQAVATDQSDYPPGSTVNITGSGFQPGETVQLQVLRIDINENSGAEHVPWTATADTRGGFQTAWSVTPDEAGATLQLTATGLTSGLAAQTTFTDTAMIPTPASASISADTAGAGGSGTFTSLTGPVVQEVAKGDVGTGTIILNAPSGFEFSTSSSVTVTSARTAGTGSDTQVLFTGGVSTVNVTPTATTITVTVASADAGGSTVRSSITWSGIKVRPTAGMPLASGNITMSSSSTAGIAGITKGTTSFGVLTEVAGTAAAIQFVQAPPSTVTAGTTLSPAVTVRTTDQFSNPASGRSVTLSLNGGGTLTGGGAQTTASGTGIATFSGLSISQTGSKTLTANVSSPALSVTSGSFTVTPGAIDHYVVSATTPPARGTAFGVTVTAQDMNNNTVTTDSSTVVTFTSSTRNALFDGSGDNSFSDNTVTLSSGTFTINAEDNFGETVTLTATDANSKTGTSSSITLNALTGDFRSNVSPSGDWDAVESWQTWNGSTWVAAASVPTGAAGVNITIQSGHTITLRAATNLLGTLLVSGTLSFSGSGVLTVGSTGVVQSTGTINGSASSLTFNWGATYQHNFTTTAGSIPTATWNTGSSCVIIGYTSNSTAPGGLGQTFYNFTWNCPNQRADLSLGGSLTTIAGDLSVVNTGTAAQLQLKSSSGTATTTVSGNYNQSGGTFVVKSGSTGTGTLNVGGFSLTGGTFYMTASSGTSVLNVGGDFSVTGAGVFTRGGSSTATVYFKGSSPQNFTNSGVMQGTINYTVNSGATLLMGTNLLTGAGLFILSSGAGLGIGDPNGITSGTTASGNIQVTGGRIFNSGCRYIYNGTTAQVTGSGLPTTITGSVTNANSAGLFLTANLTINSLGVFAVNSGALMTMGTATISGTGTFTLANDGTLAIGSTAGITASGATGNIQTTTRSFSAGGNYIYNGTAAQEAGNGLPGTINSLSISNTAGAVTLAQVATITTSVTLASGAKLSLPGGVSTAATLSIAGVNEASGTWGNTGSGATHIDSTDFEGTGVLNVTSCAAQAAIAGISTLSPATATEPSDGAATLLLTVQARDIHTNNLAVGGSVVEVFKVSGAGTLSPTTDHGDGTYTAILTSPTTTGTTILGATLDGVTVGTGVGASTSTITFVPGPVSATHSTVTANPTNSVTADGVNFSIITVALKDAHDNPISGETVALSVAGHSYSISAPVLTDANGLTTATIKSTLAETKTISASVGATSITQQAMITFVAAAPNPFASSVSVSPNNNVLADGTTVATITVTLMDANFNPVPGQAVTVSVSGSGNTVSTPAATDVNGQTTATVSSTVVGTKTVSARFGSTTIVQQPTVTFVGAPATQLVFTTQPSSATYGSALSPAVVVKTRDAAGNDSTTGLPSSQIVTLTLSGGAGSLQGTTSLDIGTAAGNGTVSFSNLKVSVAGSGKQLTASATGLTNAVSAPFTITPASTLSALSSSANPALPDATVSFTNTLSVVAPGGGTPTGTVTFRDGTNALGTASLNGSAVATFSTNSLAHGVHLISAEYAGDGNFLGSTNSLSPNELINRSPTIGTSQFSCLRQAGSGLRLCISSLLTNANVSDPDGDTVSLAAVGSPAINGATVLIDGSFILYTPAAVEGNVNDSFSYTVADSFGGANQGRVNVLVTNIASGVCREVYCCPNGSILLKFDAIANYTYVVQRATNSNGPWSDLGTNVAAGNGLFQYVDPEPPQPQGFYRVRLP